MENERLISLLELLGKCNTEKIFEPICIIIEDIGEIFFLKQDNSSEEALVGLLNHEVESVRYAAYCYLIAYPEQLNKSSIKELDRFANDPKNKTIIRQAKKCILHN